jgi:hypothetical protein
MKSMDTAPSTIPDPRIFPDARSASPAAAACYALAESSLAAETRQRADMLDAELRSALAAQLAGDGAVLSATINGSPSVAVARHVWRALDAQWRSISDSMGAGITVTVFAIPVVIVAGLESATGKATLSGVFDDPAALAAILQEHGAVAGNRTLALSNALVGSDAIDVQRLPEILAWRQLPDVPAAGTLLPPRMLEPSPLALAAGPEAVHLRFVVGTALARPGAELLADTTVGKWALPFTKALSGQIGLTQTPVLALPRAPLHLLPAVQQGRAAQREVSAQLFASNAIRRMRAAVGEPSAVISAHRAADAPGGGELRLSLSSPFEPRDAEGVRCRLYLLDRPGDVAAMLTLLLRDYRVSDVRVIGGIHADRDLTTGLPLLFKPATIEDHAGSAAHC